MSVSDKLYEAWHEKLGHREYRLSVTMRCMEGGRGGPTPGGSMRPALTDLLQIGAAERAPWRARAGAAVAYAPARTTPELGRACSLLVKPPAPNRCGHPLRVLSVSGAVLELDDRILALPAESLDFASLAALEWPLGDFVGDSSCVERGAADQAKEAKETAGGAADQAKEAKETAGDSNGEG